MKRIPINLGWTRSLGKQLPWERAKDLKTVNLPDDFVLDLPRSEGAPGGARVGYFGDGFATYEKTIDIPALSGKTVLLSLDGAYMNAEISLNADLIAMHPYGYTPIVVDLTNRLRFDMPNALSITTQSDQPSSRWYSGGGLFREVSLLAGEPCYADPRDICVTTPEIAPERATVRVQAKIANALSEEKAAKIRLTLSRMGSIAGQGEADIVLAPGAKTPFDMELAIREPALWDDIAPNLYTLTLSVCADGQEPDETGMEIGLRKIEVSVEEGLKVNGRKLKLFGGCIHHDNGALGARALPRAEERKIENLKAAGFNAIRTAHNPPSEALLAACDRLGVYVIDEFFDCWRIGKNQNDYHKYFESWWQRDIEDTMLRDRNHPCVYCWSFGNEIRETMGSADGVYWVKAQSDFIRSIDSTRLVTCGGMFLPKNMTDDGFPGGPGGPPTRANPYMTEETQNANWMAMADCLDIVSLNYSFRNYAHFAKVCPGKPLQGTETQGIDAWGNRCAVMDNEHVIGDFMWTAHDNLGEAGAGRSYWEKPKARTGLMGGWPWMSCYQGDLALDGERLPRSYYRKVIWGMDAGVALFAAHPSHAGQELYGMGFHWHDVKKTWNFVEEYIGKPVDVEAYADCDTVEFYVNGALAASCSPVECVAKASVVYAPGELRAKALRAGAVVAEDAIETTGPAVRIELTADRERLSADGMDLAYVRATLVDEKGRRVTDRDCELTASACGAGGIEGFGSNNPCTEENYGTGRRFSFDGRATIVLRAGTVPGDIALCVLANGLPAANLSVAVR